MVKYTIPMLFLTLAAASARAGVVTVNASLPEGATAVDARYEADEARGTAWVAVRWVLDEPVGEGPRIDETAVLVPGLSYDASQRAIRLDEAGNTRLVATKKHALFTTAWRSAPGARLSLAGPVTAARVVVETGDATALAKASR